MFCLLQKILYTPTSPNSDNFCDSYFDINIHANVHVYNAMNNVHIYKCYSLYYMVKLHFKGRSTSTIPMYVLYKKLIQYIRQYTLAA